MNRPLIAVLLGLLAAVWEISVTPFLPFGWGIRPLLPLLVLLLVSSSRSRALFAAWAAGTLIDAYNVASLDLAIIRLTLLIFLLDIFVRHFLTNRSLYVAIALVLVARFFDGATKWIFSHLLAWASGSHTGWNFGGAVWWFAMLWDVILVSLGFLLLAYMTRRFLTLVHRSDPSPFDQL